MRKLLAIAGVVLALNVWAQEETKECVCFELKGKFGEEIRAILEKYTKNLGDGQIRVVTEESYEAEEAKSITDSMLGIFTPDDRPISKKVKGKDSSRVQGVYAHDCATCHGDNGMDTSQSKAISAMEAEKIFDVLQTYRDGTYKGAARFIKNSSMRTLSYDELEILSHYITTLKDKKVEKK